MLNNFIGYTVIGSPNLETSVAGQEICPSPTVYFSILNNQDCHISINGGEYIYVRAYQGLQIDIVKSCRIQESGIQFNYTATVGVV